MDLLDADAASERLRDLIHLETQRAERGLDLTVDEVARVTGPGQLDFGGSEFEPADCSTLEPELRTRGSSPPRAVIRSWHCSRSARAAVA